MYRGKDIGNKEELIATCHGLLQRGSLERLYSVLPHMSVLRCPSFLDPLSELLRSGTRSKQIFAAMALGAIAHPGGLLALVDRFEEPSARTGRGSRSLQTAIIVAMGEIGSEEGVEALHKIFVLEQAGDAFTRKRRRMVVASMGKLLQQDVEAARGALLGMLRHPEAGVRAQAALELGTGYWHIPDHVPEPVIQALVESSQDSVLEVRMAAFSAIYGLAQIGCPAAGDLFETRGGL